MRDLYHEAWRDNWGFTPMTENELAHLAGLLTAVPVPPIVRLAQVGGRPVGFSILKQALAPARGRLTRWGLPIGAWRLHRALHRVDRGRLLAVGVPSRQRHPGIGAVLALDAALIARARGWREVEVSWVLENNHAANRPLTSIGAAVFKRHRLCTRRLDHQGPA
ncbi:hypothetical protein [Streptomyces lavendulae]|uniref:hypothetical protein n=1 Tax=Streptomyces lavendulae TaxID=1914 RepID=UPI0031ED9085